MSEKVGISPAVQAANTLTARWCTRAGSGDFVLSGAGLWPLLALLASAADDTARAELEEALGRPASSAVADALELIAVLRTGESTTAALGVWAREDIPLHEEWASQLPSGVIGTLTDQEALDKWAAEETDGLIKKFPLDLTPETMLILASALATKVKWVDPFGASPRNEDEESAPPDQQWLSRRTYNLAHAAVLDDAVTRVVVQGEGDVDVHLLLGDQDPAEVLATGLRELAGEAGVCSAVDLESGGPGLAISQDTSLSHRDRLWLELPSFEISARHDLIEQAELFGLRAVTSRYVPHLPLLSPVELSVSEGVQEVLARFFAEGFEAAAVTAFGMIPTGAALQEVYEVKLVEVTFDRPFGFLAVHRPSGLAVVAGWVSSPFEGDAA